jgi:hypothetical protein
MIASTGFSILSKASFILFFIFSPAKFIDSKASCSFPLGK